MGQPYEKAPGRLAGRNPILNPRSRTAKLRVAPAPVEPPAPSRRSVRTPAPGRAWSSRLSISLPDSRATRCRSVPAHEVRRQLAEMTT